MKTITQKQIAAVLRVKQPTVSKYLNGKLRLSVNNALLLEDKLGIPVTAWQDIKSYLSNPSKPPDDKTSLKE